MILNRNRDRADTLRLKTGDPDHVSAQPKPLDAPGKAPMPGGSTEKESKSNSKETVRDGGADHGRPHYCWMYCGSLVK